MLRPLQFHDGLVGTPPNPYRTPSPPPPEPEVCAVCHHPQCPIDWMCRQDRARERARREADAWRWNVAFFALVGGALCTLAEHLLR